MIFSINMPPNISGTSLSLFANPAAPGENIGTAGGRAEAQFPHLQNGANILRVVAMRIKCYYLYSTRTALNI